MFLKEDIPFMAKKAREGGGVTIGELHRKLYKENL